ncbi:hypothetical protein WH390_01205 [Candidatus Arsenophonus nilaparvatae]|uniref:hypothetical protein n=1 Tax=Candidatus Arsenophonus nilaparvatae TaxID=1247023 RepID=UPI000509C5F0|nr:hypothetical protein [Candidatus Arsenophonus nilaparvatae]
MKILIIDNIVSSIAPSSLKETKLLDDRLRENIMATNGNDFSEVNKKSGVNIIFFTQLREIYDKAQEDEEEGL